MKFKVPLSRPVSLQVFSPSGKRTPREREKEKKRE
jgi:hypothetical protein